jgi:hypothetical protein
MKSLLIFASLLSTNYLMAGTLNTNDHQKVLKELVGKLGPVDISETRKFFFSNFTNQSITISNTVEELAVSISSNQNDEGLFISMAGSHSDTTVLSLDKDKNRVLTQTELITYNNSPEVYSKTVLTIKALGEGLRDYRLDASIVNSVYFTYDSSNADSSKWSFKPAKKPEVLKDNATAFFVLSLSETEMIALGARAQLQVKEERVPQLTDCSIDPSGYLMRCDYSLETDYTPDTLHTVFSIKDGKISELLDANIEPGC